MDINARLQLAHPQLADLLGGFVEPIEVWNRLETHRAFWRPERARVILLAESHVRTVSVELERSLKPMADFPPSLPRGFVRLVYSLGYGENSALDQPIIHPPNDGTWQFWKIFFACVYGAQNDASFVPILKTGTSDFRQRLLNKLEVLRQIRQRGVWLLDASVAALYSPIGSTLQRPRPSVCRNTITLSWDLLTGEIIRDAAPEAVLCTGVGVAKALRLRLDKLGIPWGAVHQPQSRLTSGGHTKNWEAYRSICAKPLDVRGLPSVL
jgi:hypothetical protein